MRRPSHRGEPAPNRPGEHLRAGLSIGPFVLERFLGAGGMGQVWEAREEGLGRRVALKLRRPGRDDERSLSEFRREARAGARLRHPNLVATYASGEDEGLAWIAQELVPDARTLADFLVRQRRQRALPAGYFREVARLIAALAEGLDAAHAAGVIHRDVKPANVLLDAAGAPRLTDFGLARVIDEDAISATGDLAGTWAYMSPEQVGAARRRIDHRTDVFSLGAVLYELLTLRRAFDGDTVQLTADQILHVDPPPPRTLRSGCPRDLSVVCMKALEKAPERRYASAGELALDLRRHLADEPVHARPPSRLDRALRWARRNPVPVTGVALGGLALIAVATLLAGTLRDAHELRRLADERARLARAAEADRDAVLRLAASIAVEDLVAEQRELWPPHPERIGDYERWIADAEALVSKLPDHRARLGEVRASGPTTAFAPAGAVGARWWEERLTELVAQVEALRDGLLRPGYASTEDGWSVPDRLVFARRLERGLAPGGDLRAAWERHLPALRAAHPELGLEPVTGLVPLGPDPDSGLWEFAHLASGTVPSRGSDGALDLDAESGVVLVLLPGGKTFIGAQDEDPNLPNHAPGLADLLQARPLHELELPAAWISKYELTQGQWRRLKGENPSAHAPRTDGRFGELHPVESIALEETVAVLGRFGLEVPSDALWEHACRAGTDTPFAFGSDARAGDRVNVCDRTAFASQVDWATPARDAKHDDGAVFQAPVGTWPPNGFGLHEMHGNVSEYSVLRAEGAGDADPEGVYLRGGSYRDPLAAARSYARQPISPESRRSGSGVRPARSLPAPDGH